MNNLIFNTAAGQLKTSIYAVAPDDSIQAVKVDASNYLMTAITAPVTIGNASLTVAGTVTVAEVTAPVTIGNASLTVAGTVTVAEVTAPVTIGNASLTVAGTVTVAEVTAPVTIGNASLTVAGTVTVAEVTAPVTIGNASLTVAGTVTIAEVTAPVTIGNASLTVAGTVTVAEVTAPVTIGNASLTVAGTVTIGNATITTILNGSAFSSLTVTSTVHTGTGVIFGDTDISTLKNAAVFLYNGGAQPITVSVQISPSTTDAEYMNDPNWTDKVLAASGTLYFESFSFGHYARLAFDTGASAGTFTAYLQLQA